MKTQSSRKRVLTALSVAVLLGASGVWSQNVVADQAKPAATPPPQVKFTPEFMARVKALPPSFLKQFKGIAKKHDRKSAKATLRQVMLELASDTQCVVMGIASDSYEMVVECAARASHHRFPRGHLLAYGPLDNISMDFLKSIPSVNAQVEGGFDRIAEYARNENMMGAAEEFGKVMAGCVQCHAIFRMDMGNSPYIVD